MMIVGSIITYLRDSLKNSDLNTCIWLLKNSISINDAYFYLAKYLANYFYLAHRHDFECWHVEYAYSALYIKTIQKQG